MPGERGGLGTPARVVDDLVVVTVATVATGLLVLLPGPGWVRAGVAVGFLLMVPGYAATAVLFPQPRRETDDDASPSFLETILLSVALSIVIAFATGIALHAAPVAITTASVTVGLGTVTLLLAVGGAIRRHRAAEPIADRPLRREWMQVVRWRWTPATAVLLAVLLMAGGVAGFLLVGPHQTDPYTELYLLDDDGSQVRVLTSADPDENGRLPITVGVENHVGSATAYIVVVTEQSTTTEGGSVAVEEERELDRTTISLANDEAWRRTLSLSPREDSTRIAISLHERPDDPVDASEIGRVHVWLTDPGGADDGSPEAGRV